MCPPTEPLQWYLGSQLLMFEFLERKAVVEKHIKSSHCINPSDAPFFVFLFFLIFIFTYFTL